MARWLRILWQHLLVFLPLLGGAQDTIALADTVHITAIREQLLRPGSIVWSPDSTDRSLFAGTSVDQLLMLGSNAYVRSYGGGNVGLVSIRGGTAEQTLVTWNGVPVNQSGSGLCDLSLLPLWMVADTRMEAGGNGLKEGSGSVNGILSMNQAPLFRAGVSSAFRMEYASSGRLAQMGQVGIGSPKWQADIRFFHQYDANRFPFMDADSIRKNVHGDIWQWAGGAMVRRLLGRSSHLTWTGFYTGMIRLLSPVRSQVRSAAWQGDTLVRNSLTWVYARSSGILRVVAGANTDITRYANPWISTDETSRFAGYHGLVYYEWVSKGPWTWGMDGAVHRLTGISEAYGDKQQITRLAAGGWILWKPDSLTSITGGVRYETQAPRQAPLLPGLTVVRQFRTWKTYLKGSRMYRMPTLNMMFWNPGGNPSLRPEHGFSISGGLASIPWKVGTGTMSIALDLFSQRVRDLMQWRPSDAGYWSPVNLGQVWSRGAEIQAEVVGKYRGAVFSIRGWGALTRCTETTPGSPLKGLQLMYVPMLSAGARVSIQTGSWAFLWTMPWTGLRYTQPDHGWWLPWNMTGNLAAEWNPKSAHLPISLGVRVTNIWNESMEMVAGRPMPGRVISAFLQLNIEPKQQ